ncbi:EMC1_C domain-containing protein, partial [Haematococcus lacustris]
ALAASSGARQTIGVFIGSQIKTFSAVSGDELASLHAQDLSPLTATRLLQATAGNGFTGYSYEAGSTTVNVHMTDSSSIRNTHASLPQPLSSIAVSAAWGMAALSADGSSVCTIDIRSQPDLHSTCTPLAAFEADSVRVERGSTVQLVATASGLALASGSPTSQHLLPAELPGVLLMALPAGDQGSGSGQLTLTKAFPDASAVSQAAEAAAGQVVALVEVNQQGSVVVQYASTATGTILASDGSVKGSSIGVDKLAAGASPPGMRAVLLGVFKKKDGSDGFRVLLVWADERIALLQQGVTVWARDEALAGVTNALFTDLPSAVAKGEAEGMDFKTFFKLQLLGFKLVPLGKVAVGDHAEQSLFLAGFGFDSVAVAALTSAAGGAATAVPVWSLALPEARLAVQGRRPEEPVYTAVK